MEDLQPYFIFSNSMERLVSALAAAIYYPGCDPFALRVLVVPSASIKEWAFQWIAKNQGVAFGILPCSLQESIQFISQNYSQLPQHIPSEIELNLAIEEILEDIWASYPYFNSKQQELWGPLFEYLKAASFETSQEYRQRVNGLKNQLGYLFANYGVHAPNLCNSMLEKPEDFGWQGMLWHLIYTKYHKNWIYPAKKTLQQDIKSSERFQKKLEIHLFGFSYIPQIYIDYFLRISRSIPTYGYVLSPCAQFWGDQASDKEKVFLQKRWEIQGIHAGTQMALSDFLSDRNSLLANLGKLGKRFNQALENRKHEVLEHYQWPVTQDVLDLYYPEWANSNMGYASSESQYSLLNAIKMDLLVSRNPQQGSKMEIFTDDYSVEIHSATSRFREVQILYQNILDLLHRNKHSDNPITLGDIIVMAPRIEEYEPYIKIVFSAEEYPIKYQILDLSLQKEHPTISSFWKLISLSESRWEAKTVFELFEDPVFRSCQGWDEEDLETIEKWIKEANICWGFDEEHCHTLINTQNNNRQRKIHQNTWNDGFDTLINSLILLYHEKEQSNSSVEFSQAPLLGKVISLLESLYHDVSWFIDKSKRSISDWADFLICIQETYLLDSSKFSNTQENPLDDLLLKFKKSHRYFQEKEFNFSVIKPLLRKQIQRQAEKSFHQHLGMLSFSSMFPMRAVPAKAIFLLGLNEDTYPREEKFSALNLMKQPGSKEQSPSQADIDRYIFIETILSAQNFLRISYLRQTETDKKKLEPSVIVSEFLNYINQGYQKGDLQAPIEIKHHSEYPFDPYYFKPTSNLRSFSRKNYAIASRRNSNSPEIPKIELSKTIESSCGKNTSACSENSSKKRFDIKTLQTAVTDPFQLYCNEELNLFIPRKKEINLASEEIFYPQSWEFYAAKKESLQTSPEKALDTFKRKNGIPYGAFKEASEERFLVESRALFDLVQQMGINSESFFEAIFIPAIGSKNISNEKRQFLSPLRYTANGQEFEFVGKISEICPQGIIQFSKDDVSQAMKTLPKALFLSLAIAQGVMPNIEPTLYFLVSQKKYSCELWHSLLTPFLEYIEICQNKPALFLPDWIPTIIKKDVKAFRKHIESFFGEYTYGNYSPYLKWYLQGSKQLLEEELFDFWSPILAGWYSPFTSYYS